MDSVRDTRKAQRSPYQQGRGCIGGPDVLGQLMTAGDYEEERMKNELSNSKEGEVSKEGLSTGG